jgi:hypothetical protein
MIDAKLGVSAAKIVFNARYYLDTCYLSFIVPMPMICVVSLKLMV